MKRLGIITLMAAALTLGLTFSMPASAEARWNGGQHHQGQGWRQGGDPGYQQQGQGWRQGGGPGYHKQGQGWRQGGGPGYHKQGYYRHGNQGRAWHKAGWSNYHNQKPRHKPAPNWCPNR